MKSYIITSNEYDIVNRRLNRLYDRKTKLYNNITSCTSKPKEVLTNGGVVSDKMTDYVAEMEEVDKEIKDLEEQAAKLRDDLDYMDSRLSNINEIKEQVFVKYFIKGMKPKDIAPKIPCGKSSVYRYIDEINKERASWEKIRKI